MKKTKQLSFLNKTNHHKFFGGALLAGKRKTLRPLSSKDATHLVMRSARARGKDSFLASRNRAAITLLILRFAKKIGVRIYQLSVNSNHIHLLLKISNRTLYKAFIKAVCGKIASQVMSGRSFKNFCESKNERSDAIRGYGPDARKIKTGFWEFRPFSRVVNWGNDFKTCSEYLKQNVLEALGFKAYRPRKNIYSRWLKHSIPDLL